MNTIEGTIITMQDGEEIFLEFSKEQVNNAIDEAKGVGRNYIKIDYLDRDIYFNYIKDKRSKVRHLALEEPKQRELTKQEKEKYKLELQRIHEKWKENPEIRKKKFIERRKDILEKLAKEEKMLGLETTLNKIEEYNILTLTK